MSTLSPTAQAAIASCGGPHDLQLKTEFGPKTRVLTSYMPVSRDYRSDVIAPDDVIAAMYALKLWTKSRYATRDEATKGHAQVVTRVGMLLQRMKPTAPRVRAKRLCMPCDELVTGKECPKCGADTEPWPAGETL